MGPKKSWWFIDNDSSYGWVEGSFQQETVQLFVRWLEALSNFPCVASDKFGLFGWSAGAYAVTEIMAAGGPYLSGVGLGAVHGHGQLDPDGLPPKYKEIAPVKFEAYIERMQMMSCIPWIEATHGITDTESKWSDAQAIFEALTQAQEGWGQSEVSVRALEPEEQDVRPNAKKNKAHHTYFNASFLRKEFFVALFGGETPDQAAFMNRKKPEKTVDYTEVKPVSKLATASVKPVSKLATTGVAARNGAAKQPTLMSILRAMMNDSEEDESDEGWQKPKLATGGANTKRAIPNKVPVAGDSKAGWLKRLAEGPKTERTILNEEPMYGTVVEWKKDKGWVKPDE